MRYIDRRRNLSDNDEQMQCDSRMDDDDDAVAQVISEEMHKLKTVWLLLLVIQKLCI